MGRGPEYTEAELCRAFELRAQGLKWRQVAERLGRRQESLCSTLTRYKQGKLFSAKSRAIRERNMRMIAAAERGESTTEIAAREGLYVALVCTTLAGYGLDSEMRALIRRELEQKAA